jgi:hypothetical protein
LGVSQGYPIQLAHLRLDYGIPGAKTYNKFYCTEGGWPGKHACYNSVMSLVSSVVISDILKYAFLFKYLFASLANACILIYRVKYTEILLF